jgi:NAD(P)-dependent dehydrogenase (short-subunit alcohol dehydrogenase family)
MNIIVNGGTQGIGREVVKYLAQDSANQIIATGRNKSVLNKLSLKHKNVKFLYADMSVFETQNDKFRVVVADNFRRVDILINLAGLLITKPFLDMSNEEARLIMETNFFGPALLVRTLQPLMVSGSHIVNISSMGGFQGSAKFKGLSFYSASKAALACLTECLSNEFSEHGISVNCLALGAVQTKMLDKAFPGYKAPVTAKQMGEFISEFALTGNRFFNGKILPVAVSNP